jgi:hypothetical protein
LETGSVEKETHKGHSTLYNPTVPGIGKASGLKALTATASPFPDGLGRVPITRKLNKKRAGYNQPLN